MDMPAFARALVLIGWVCLGIEVVAAALLGVALVSPATASRMQMAANVLPIAGFLPLGGAILMAAFAQERLQRAEQKRTGRRPTFSVPGLSWAGLTGRSPQVIRVLGFGGAIAGFAVSLWTGPVGTVAGEVLDPREVQGSLAWAMVAWGIAAPLLASKGVSLMRPAEAMPGERDAVR